MEKRINGTLPARTSTTISNVPDKSIVADTANNAPRRDLTWLYSTNLEIPIVSSQKHEETKQFLTDMFENGSLESHIEKDEDKVLKSARYVKATFKCGRCEKFPAPGTRLCYSTLCRKVYKDRIVKRIHIFCESSCLPSMVGHAEEDRPNGLLVCPDWTDHGACTDFGLANIGYKEFPTFVKMTWKIDRCYKKLLSRETYADRRDQSMKLHTSDKGLQKELESELLKADRKEALQKINQRVKMRKERELAHRKRENEREIVDFLNRHVPITDNRVLSKRSIQLHKKRIKLGKQQTLEKKCFTCFKVFGTKNQLNTHRRNDHYNYIGCGITRFGFTCQFVTDDEKKVAVHREGKDCPWFKDAKTRSAYRTCPYCGLISDRMSRSLVHRSKCPKQP